jgi:hypothetical protein
MGPIETIVAENAGEIALFILFNIRQIQENKHKNYCYYANV